MLQNKVVDIMLNILKEMSNNLSHEDIQIKLKKDKKYNEKEISSAYSLLYEKVFSKKGTSKYRKKAFRIYSETEKEVIGEDNYKYLMTLKQYSLLNDEDIEFLVDQLLLAEETEITKDQINLMVLFSLTDREEFFTNLGSRSYITPNDSIN